MKIFYILVLSTILYSCSDNIEQSYKDFNEFNQTDLRHKSWFPDFISADCYYLKEIHNLNNNNSFGVFSYKQSFRIDSMLSDRKVYENITIDTLNKFLSRITTPNKPAWFLDKDQIQSDVFYRHNSMYLINDTQGKKLYFVYSTM